MAALLSFLKRNTIMVGEALPLVHSTDSLFLKDILSSKLIDAKNDCEVFREHLNYFFVGRPAYKREIGHEAEYWELPCCFVLNDIVAKPKRIYPFDSGAFKSNTKVYPQFITMMNLDEFEISQDPRAIEKIIGTFFTSRARYFSLKPRESNDFRRRFGIEVTDEEIAALYKLIDFKGGGDDRRLSIEVQYSEPIGLNQKNVLAVVLPEIYLTSGVIMKAIEVDLKAEVLSYQVYPMKKEFHYHAIYSVVHEFYREKGII